MMAKIILLSITLLVSNLLASSISFANENNTKKEYLTITINSLDELMALFKEHKYTHSDWLAGNREIPRITFDDVSEKWRKTSNNIPVKQKKQVFFRLMAPLVLMSNENILAERNIVKSAKLNSPQLLAIAIKYQQVSNDAVALTQEQRENLLLQVDIMPPSLVLAQAAEESGWATSRFTEEGNAFFGQWDFSGNGMVPKQQRKELGNYGLARFDSPLASVEGYMLNINTHSAYKKLRNLRAELRENKQPVTGLALAGTLDKYSERGQAYIDGIRSMISYNKLEDVDNAYLSKDNLIKLTASKKP